MAQKQWCAKDEGHGEERTQYKQPTTAMVWCMWVPDGTPSTSCSLTFETSTCFAALIGFTFTRSAHTAPGSPEISGSDRRWSRTNPTCCSTDCSSSILLPHHRPHQAQLYTYCSQLELEEACNSNKIGSWNPEINEAIAASQCHGGTYQQRQWWAQCVYGWSDG